MAWTDVNYEEVTTGRSLLPIGDYTFMLVSASRGRFDVEVVDMRVSVATPGPYQGETLFHKYPNPEKADKRQSASSPNNWVNKAFKLFLNAVKPYGFLMAQGEHPVDFINRICAEADQKNESILFDARIEHDSYTNKESGELVACHRIVLKSIKACEGSQ